MSEGPNQVERRIESTKRSGIRNWLDGGTIAERWRNVDPDIVHQICERIVEHGESISKICKEKTVPGAPNVISLFYWRKADPRIDDAIRAAMEARAELRWDSLEEEIKAMFYDDEGNPIGPQEAKVMAQLARTKFDARRFEVSKLVPRLYGDEAPASKSQLEKLMEDGKIQVVKYVEMPKKQPPAEESDEVKKLDEGRKDVGITGVPLAGYIDTGAVPSSE